MSYQQLNPQERMELYRPNWYGKEFVAPETVHPLLFFGD